MFENSSFRTRVEQIWPKTAQNDWHADVRPLSCNASELPLFLVILCHLFHVLYCSGERNKTENVNAYDVVSTLRHRDLMQVGVNKTLL